MADEVSKDVVSVVDITQSSGSSPAQQLHAITFKNRNVIQLLALVKTLKIHWYLPPSYFCNDQTLSIETTYPLHWPIYQPVWGYWRRPVLDFDPFATMV